MSILSSDSHGIHLVISSDTKTVKASLSSLKPKGFIRLKPFLIVVLRKQLHTEDSLDISE